MTATISLIAAVGQNLELGYRNDLLWHLPDDFAWFVNHTKGHPIIMGRKTMESLGKPLKNRRNLVISRQLKEVPDGYELFHSLEAALASANETEKEEIYIIGGGEIFRECINTIAQKLYITRVHGNFPNADVFFPPWHSEWHSIYFKHHPIDEKHAYTFDFIILVKKNT